MIGHFRKLARDRQLKKPSPPLPYRIAKALDPYIYRNVELDIWEEEKRELKKESPEYRERFAAGDKCEVILGGCHYHGHIQEINDQENTAIVFIQELGEKKTVLISCLKTPPNRNYCSHYNRFFRRKQELAIQGQQHSEYSNYSSSKSPGYSSSYTSAEAGQQGYLIAAGAFSNNNTMTNANTGYVGMDTTPVQALDNANKNNLNQAAVPGVMQQYTPPMMAYQQQTNPYMYNNAVVPQQTYSCVCVPHLESIAVQAVNMNTGPSKDSGGKDLPEMNTLRFFYNLGVENYRLISTSSTSPPANPRWPPVEMNAVMPPNNMMMVDQMNGNTCGQFAGQAAPYTWCKYDVGDDNNTNVNMSSQMFYYSQSHVPPTTCLPVCDTPGSASTTSKSSSSTSNSAMSSPSKNSEAAPSTVSSDEMADCNDSGCDSDSTGSANSDMFKEMDDKTTTAPDHDSNAVELEKKLDNYIAHVKDNEPESISTPIFQTPNTPKQKSKRKYYMYGNLKLVKPIKDIPPRYLKLLSNLNSEKHRCEGDPIIVPFLPPKPHYNKYNNNHNLNHAQTRCSQTQGNAGSGFNPEAKSFVPSNPVIHDPSIIACGGNVATDPSNGVHMYPNGVGVNSAYNCNVIYSHTGNNITGGSNINGVGNNSNQSTCSSPCSNNNTSTNPAGDGSMYCMPPSFSAGQACPYPGATPVQCPVYYTGAPQNCAVPPNQMAPGAYVPAQNCGVMPATMPMHTIQMT